MTATLTLTDFLLARIAEDEAVARNSALTIEHRLVSPRRSSMWSEPSSGVLDTGDDMWPIGDSRISRHAAHFDPARVLAECEAKRRIVEWHRNWPVLVETPPEFETDPSDLNSYTMRMSKQIAWTTEQKYREHFGTEPPTGPILRLLALPYAAHPDYREEWRP